MKGEPMIGELKKVIYYKVDGIEFRAIKQGYILNTPIYSVAVIENNLRGYEVGVITEKMLKNKIKNKTYKFVKAL